MKYRAAKLASGLAHYLGATRIFGKSLHAGGCVVAMHSVVSDADPLPREHNHVSEEHLDGLLNYYSTHRIPILSLDDGLKLTMADATAPWIAFTFDDGYRDNLELGLPIFKRYGAPMTIFVTSAALDRTMECYWWGQLRHLVRSTDVIVGDEVGGKLLTATVQQKIAAYNVINKRIQSGALTVEAAENLFNSNGVSRTFALDRDCLTPNELTQLDWRANRVTIGGHSTAHVPLAGLSESQVAIDLAANRERLSVLTGSNVDYFAYPFGDKASCGQREFKIVEALGYSAAFTTRSGNVDRSTSKLMWSLPRRKVIGPVESIGFLECQRSGVLDLTMRSDN